LFLPGYGEAIEALSHRPVVSNLWYAADRLEVRENNIGNGGKHQKKGVKKTKKQSYEVLVYKERLMRKLSLDPPSTSHVIILILFYLF
jgi:hypothetical protein